MYISLSPKPAKCRHVLGRSSLDKTTMALDFFFNWLYDIFFKKLGPAEMKTGDRMDRKTISTNYPKYVFHIIIPYAL